MGICSNGMARPVNTMGICSNGMSHPLTFISDDAKGGVAYVAAKTALVLIEYQNEFTTRGGLQIYAVRDVMQDTKMLENTAKLCVEARAKGVKVFHTPITFKNNMSDNPNKSNKRLGLLRGCADGGVFVANTWNSAFSEALAPQEGDVVVSGGKGLDAFPGTNLEQLLLKHDVHTVAVGGFLTNCSVESAVRTSCEKGFNVVSLIDCAALSAGSQKAAIAATLGMCSALTTSTAFLDALK